MALIQVRVDDAVKEKADEAFARSGMTTPSGMKAIITQIANDGRTPFDGLLSSVPYEAMSECMRRAMVRAEAIELGIIPDDSSDDPTRVPNDVLDYLGINPSEVGQ